MVKVRAKWGNHLDLILGIKGILPINIGTRTREQLDHNHKNNSKERSIVTKKIKTLNRK